MQVELACDIGRRPDIRCSRTNDAKLTVSRMAMVTCIKPGAFNRTGLDWPRNA
jgi:hypothetical protein